MEKPVHDPAALLDPADDPKLQPDEIWHITSQGLPGVLWVLPDSYLDVPNKDYGGDLFIDGKVIPRPQYRHTERQQTRTRPRPRYDRCRETMQVERRDPLQRQNLAHNHGEPVQQGNSMSTAQVGGAEFSSQSKEM